MSLEGFSCGHELRQFEAGKRGNFQQRLGLWRHGWERGVTALAKRRLMRMRMTGVLVALLSVGLASSAAAAAPPRCTGRTTSATSSQSIGCSRLALP